MVLVGNRTLSYTRLRRPNSGTTDQSSLKAFFPGPGGISMKLLEAGLCRDDVKSLLSSFTNGCCIESYHRGFVNWGHRVFWATGTWLSSSPGISEPSAWNVRASPETCPGEHERVLKVRHRSRQALAWLALTALDRALFLRGCESIGWVLPGLPLRADLCSRELQASHPRAQQPEIVRCGVFTGLKPSPGSKLLGSVK